MLSIKHAPPLLRYGLAVLVAGVALGIGLLLDPMIPRDVTFLPISGAIMVSAWYGGLGPSLLTMVVAGLTTGYFLPDPKGSALGTGAEPFLVFFAEGTLVCLLIREEGCGFHSNGASRRNGPGERVGLSGMRESILTRREVRAAQRAGAGTTVEAEVELPEMRGGPQHAG